jgi:dGTPase
MDWADDVAYSVHDVEDGLHAGLIRYQPLISQRPLVSRTASDLFCDGSASIDELAETLDGLLTLPAWPRTFDGTESSLVALKALTSDLIGRFCVAARDATLDAAGCSGPAGRHSLTRYDADLVVPRQQRLECALLKAIAVVFVMTRSGAAQQQAQERELLTELAYAVERGAPDTLDPVLRPAWTAAVTDAEHRRVVIDQVASLTDTSAIAWHHRLCTRPPPRA